MLPAEGEHRAHGDHRHREPGEKCEHPSVRAIHCPDASPRHRCHRLRRAARSCPRWSRPATRCAAGTRRPERYEGKGEPVGARCVRGGVGRARARGLRCRLLPRALHGERGVRGPGPAGSACLRRGCGRIGRARRVPRRHGWRGRCFRAPAFAPRGGTHPARERRHRRAARGHRDRPRRRLVRDHAAAGRTPAGDGVPEVGDDALAADRAGRRRALPGRQPGHPAGAYDIGGADVVTYEADDAPLRPDHGPAPADREGARADAEPLVALDRPGHRPAAADRTAAGRRAERRGGGPATTASAPGSPFEPMGFDEAVRRALTG